MGQGGGQTGKKASGISSYAFFPFVGFIGYCFAVIRNVPMSNFVASTFGIEGTPNLNPFSLGSASSQVRGCVFLGEGKAVGVVAFEGYFRCLAVRILAIFLLASKSVGDDCCDGFSAFGSFYARVKNSFLSSGMILRRVLWAPRAESVKAFSYQFSGNTRIYGVVFCIFCQNRVGTKYGPFTYSCAWHHNSVGSYPCAFFNDHGSAFVAEVFNCTRGIVSMHTCLDINIAGNENVLANGDALLAVEHGAEPYGTATMDMHDGVLCGKDADPSIQTDIVADDYVAVLMSADFDAISHVYIVADFDPRYCGAPDIGYAVTLEIGSDPYGFAQVHELGHVPPKLLARVAVPQCK